jgi:hypothetical protein
MRSVSRRRFQRARAFSFGNSQRNIIVNNLESKDRSRKMKINFQAQRVIFSQSKLTQQQLLQLFHKETH